MPGYDRTGPMGQGAMTGGGRGRCNTAGPTGFNSPRMGMGFGKGRRWMPGQGQGRRFGRAMGMPMGNDVDDLREQMAAMNETLRRMTEKIEALEGKAKS